MRNAERKRNRKLGVREDEKHGAASGPWGLRPGGRAWGVAHRAERFEFGRGNYLNAEGGMWNAELLECGMGKAEKKKSIGQSDLNRTI
jgi:hypothetical protein